MKPTQIMIIGLMALMFTLLGCTQQPIACTMDAKICPDGSSVGRVGPNCEFAACPDGNNQPTACPADAKICPDGSAVGRVGPDCEFAPCPGGQAECSYDDPNKKYVAKSADECAVIKFLCAEDMTYFSDSCGCGCQSKDAGSEEGNKQNGSGEGKLAASDCLPEERGAEICTMIYKPVCGWWNPEKVQCLAYPCAQTYASRCQACANADVISVTEGECPSPGQAI